MRQNSVRDEEKHTEEPLGSGPSLCLGSDLYGKSDPLWKEWKDVWLTPLSSAGHGQMASQRLSGSSPCQPTNKKHDAKSTDFF